MDKTQGKKHTSDMAPNIILFLWFFIPLFEHLKNVGIWVT